MTGNAPHCSVVICAWNGATVLPACLTTLLASRGVDFEVIVVDNGSADGSAELVARDFPATRLIRSGRNLGYAAGNNLGLRAARGEIIVLLNQDTEVPPEWLATILAPFVRDARIGAVGCKLYYPGGRVLQHAGGILYANALTGHLGSREEDEGQWDIACERPYVTGAALGLRRAALEQVGLFDPDFFPAYYEEIDLEMRMARAGWKIWYEPAAWLVHHESQVHGVGSAKMIALYTRNRLRYLAVVGFPAGRKAALRTELEWLADMRRKGRLGAALRGYAVGLIRWPFWRLDRRARRSVPQLDGRAGNRMETP